MTIKGHRERLRMRFIQGAQDALTDKSILELLLTYSIPRKDVAPLAQTMLSEMGTLSNILAAPVEKLIKYEGLNMTTATLLKAIEWTRNNTFSKGNIKVEKRQLSFLDSLIDDGNSKVKEESVKSKTLNKLPRLFSNAVLKEAIQFLPDLPETDSMEVIRESFQGMLHYSSEQTRRKYAGYITNRIFPDAIVDLNLLRFAHCFRGQQELKDVCYYQLVRAEPLMTEISKNLLIPNVSEGKLSREMLRKYLQHKFPESGNIKNGAKAIVDALKAGGVADVNYKAINLRFRPVRLVSFAYILHCEFAEPGMYEVAAIEQNTNLQSLLWASEQMIETLYDLRNAKLISNISSIDNIRQFTTKYRIKELVEYLCKMEQQ